MSSEIVTILKHGYKELIDRVILGPTLALIQISNSDMLRYNAQK